MRLTRCLAGLTRRRLQDLSIRLIGRRPPRELLDRLLPLWCRVALSSQRDETPAEVEIAFAPSSQPYSRECDCRVLIVPRGQQAARQLVETSNLIFTAGEFRGPLKGKTFAVESLDAILQRNLGVLSGMETAARRMAAA